MHSEKSLLIFPSKQVIIKIRQKKNLMRSQKMHLPNKEEGKKKSVPFYLKAFSRKSSCFSWILCPAASAGKCPQLWMSK